MSAPIYREYKPTVPEALPFVRALYRSPGGGAGCYCLHVVLDDGNVADRFFDENPSLCRNAYDCPEWHIALVRMLRSMSPTQRLKLGGLTYTDGLTYVSLGGVDMLEAMSGFHPEVLVVLKERLAMVGAWP